MEENEVVFDAVEAKPVSNSTELQEAEEVEFGDFSDSIKFDVQLAEGDESKFFEIDSVIVKKPVTIDANGAEVPMKVSQDGKKSYYQSKLILTFKDTNYAAIVPNIKWFKSVKEVDGKQKTFLNPWFNVKLQEKDLTNNLVSDVSKLFYRYCKKKGLDIQKTTQKSFFEGLKGMKVKLESLSGEYKGKDYARLRVVEFE